MGAGQLGIDPASPTGWRIAECGFEVWDRLDGLHPIGGKAPSHYNDYLCVKGYQAENPWEDVANAAEDADGRILSGWLYENADKPARIAEEDSETPYSTTRAMELIENAGNQPWCLHLSYIKPHWPYIVPAPYHAMYGPDDVVPPVRLDEERRDAHPELAEYFEHRFSKAFALDEVRERVIPAYMGLIAQIDDQIGRLVSWMDERGITKDTLIVFTSDHGDYLGDHWLGEKERFHDPSVRVPMIVVDPSAEADATRGRVLDHLVESIELAPTFVDWFGGEPSPHILEGRSLLPLLREVAPAWRDFVVSEYDHYMRRACKVLDQPVSDCCLVMIFDGRWKYIHAEGFRPVLFDLASDPDEFVDLCDDPDCEAERTRLAECLGRWARRHHNRVTVSDSRISGRKGGELAKGIIVGFWNDEELAEARTIGDSGNGRRRHEIRSSVASPRAGASTVEHVAVKDRTDAPRALPPFLSSDPAQ